DDIDLNSPGVTRVKFNNYILEFRLLCRYLWYCHIKDLIQRNVKESSPFTQIYGKEKTKINEEKREAILKETVKYCGYLLDFSDDLHSKSYLQGSFLTVIALLKSSKLIGETLIRHFPADSLVVDRYVQYFHFW